MNRFVQVPAKGQPMTAQWGADVANGLNAIRSAGQAGTLLTDGPTGTGFAPLPVNRRDRRGGREIPPREFTLRAKVETKTEGDAKKYRLKISVFHVHESSSVTWNGLRIPSSLTDTDQGEYEYVGTLGRWIELETTEWTESFDFNKNYYLCVSVEVGFDGEGQDRQYDFTNNGMTFWEIREEAIPVVIYQGDFTWNCQTSYLLGHVKALGTNIEVRQNYDGPLHLFDLMGQMGDEGEGGENDDRNGTNYPMPFQYKRTDTVDPETGEVIESSYWIANNTFYWDGVLNQLEDFAAPATGTVYLCCTQKAPSTSGEAEWEFSLATSPEAAPSGGRVCNFKLYDFEDHHVTMDYRTTFLELKSPHETACLVVKQNSDSTPEIKLSALNSAAAEIYLTPSNKTGGVQLRCDGSTAFLTAKMGTIKYAQIFETGSFAGATFMHESKRIDLRTSNLTKGNLMDIHVLTIKDVEGNIVDELNVLSTADITIVQAKGKVLKDIKLEYNSGYLEMTKTTVDLETGEETVGDVTTVFTTEMHSAQS